MAWAGSVLIVRSLTQEDFGKFSFVFSLLGIVSIVADLGLGRVAVSGVMDTDGDRGKFAANYVVLRTLLGFFAVALAIGYVWLSNQPSDVFAATLIGSFVVLLATPGSAYDVAYQAHDRMAPVARAALLGQLAMTAFVVALVLAGGSMVWFVVPALLREVVELAAKWKGAHRLVPFRYEMDRGLWWPMLREAVPLSIGTAIAVVYYRVDVVMLEAIKGAEPVATYAVGYKFADLLHIVPLALTTSLLASMVRAWPGQLDAFRDLTRQSGQLLMLVAGLTVSGFMVFGQAAIGLLYGVDYEPGADAARLLVLSEGLIFFSLLAFTGLVATGRHTIYPIITLAGLIANVGLNLIFIPRWSFEGAAFTTLITEALVAALLWGQLLRIPGVRPLGLLNVFPTVLAALIGGVGGWLAWMVVPWPLAAVVTAVLYLGIVAMVGSGGKRGLRGLVGEALRA